MRIVVVRHGQTPLNVARVLQTDDTPLSDVGQQQALRLAPRLVELGVTRVLCSDYARARMTIAPFEAQSGIAAELHPQLRERHFGELRGRSYADLPEVFSREFVPPGGESWPAFEARVAAAWTIVTEVAAQTPGVLAVVTHGLVCHALMRRHFQLPAEMQLPDGFANTSVTIVDRHAPHRVHLAACVRHLGD